MNKYQEYQEALDILRNIEKSRNYKQIGCSLTPNSDTLQELIDKEKPKKPIRFKNSVYISTPKCPICKTTPHTGNQKYCDECGQKLDWSDE